jgi:gag-polypeptide of LTR copia-type
MKMHFNQKNVYFALHESPIDPETLLPYKLGTSTREWLQQTSGLPADQITYSKIAAHKAIHLQQLRDDFSAFKRANEVASSTILLHCSPPIRKEVQHLTSASAIWAHLERMHKIATVGDVEAVLHELEQYATRSGTLADSEIIDKIEAAKNDLEIWGVKPEVYYAIIMLRGLGRDYDEARREVYAREVRNFGWDEFVEWMMLDVAGAFR